MGTAAVDPSANWIAVGAGTGDVTVYHIGSRIPTSVLSTGSSVLCTAFHDGQVSTSCAA